MTPEDRLKSVRAEGATPSERDWIAFRDRAHRSVARRRAAGAIAGAGVLAAVVAGYFLVAADSPREERGPGVAATPTDEATPSPTPTAELTPGPPAKQTAYLQQWFYDKDDRLQIYYVKVPRSQTPATDALKELLQGAPVPGATTAIPEGTELEEVTIKNGTAAVTLTGDLPAAYEKAQAQVIYTVTQFDTVRNARLTWRSDSETVVPEATPENRKDYEELLAYIVVEQPFEGQTVDGTFTLSGIANVFEATVSYRILDGNGTTIQEGFTTATCGTGCYGTFEKEITYEGTKKYAVLQVFQSSAENGEPLDMVETPLNFK